MKTREVKFSLTEIMIVILVIGVLVMIGFPLLAKARERRLANQCREQLIVIRDLKAQARTNNFSLVELAEQIKGKYKCPLDGIYDIGDHGKDPRCSFRGTPSTPHTLEQEP